MRKLPLLVTLGVFLGIAGGASPSLAESNVAADMGRGLAERTCANCHEVEPNQAKPAENPGAPKFVDVANRPGTTPDSLREHLKRTHSNKIIPMGMPNPGLSDDETTKIVAYIMSLRKPH